MTALKRSSHPRYRINTLVRLFFLLLTPVLFRWINPGFVWHSIFYRSVTVVLLLWGGAVILVPLFGRFACGWICPFGTIQDLIAPVRVCEPRRERPLVTFRWTMVTLFLLSAFGVSGLVRGVGLLEGWRWAPLLLDNEFTPHYKHVWLYVTVSISILSLFVGRRGLCRNLCAFGTSCAVAARASRLVPLVLEHCNGCRRCDAACPARVRVSAFREAGAVKDPECILCGLCADVCPKGAIRFGFLWSGADRQANTASSAGETRCV